MPAPAWWDELIDLTVRWLVGGYRSDNTRTTYATTLGVPRERQIWRTAQPRHPRPPLAHAFLVWAARYDIDPIDGMDLDMIRAWITYARAHGDSPKTLGTRVGAVCSWYRELRKRERTSFNPGDLLDRQERSNLAISNPAPASPTVPLTMAQVRALRVAAELDAGTLRLRNIAVVAVLAATGIRAEELCALTRADVHRSGPDGRPALWIDGKGAKRRWVRLPRAELEAIDAYLAARDAVDVGTELTVAGQVSSRQRGSERVFLSSAGGPLTPHVVTQLLQYLCRSLRRDRSTSSTVRSAAAELRPLVDTIHPHQFRHFYAVEAVRHGVSVKQVQTDLGHATLHTTQRYLESLGALSNSGAVVVSDLMHAGEHLTLLPSPKEEP
ncbi:recombinase XerD [Prauserella sp. PE36]|uniref:tyrosine-type recombinase/integrase n=1 Tax=Prauserella sp. PE36 TaxID=1504709 RepID=UPI000DE2237C|nr:tyrosine-type recombinase/integrase [Prauserella sp. PE36]RBM22472.1 recombinase XerD [Prauserella sp. PE36]